MRAASTALAVIAFATLAGGVAAPADVPPMPVNPAFVRVDVPPAHEAPAALPAPALPRWIDEVSPVGPATTPEQIRIRFGTALVDDVPRDDPTRIAALAAFHLEPAARGRFRFASPRLVVFEASEPLANATRYRVTVDAGLRDVAGDRLIAPLRWTFDTTRIRFTLHPERDPIDVEPSLYIGSTMPLDPKTLPGRFALVNDGVRIPLVVYQNLQLERGGQRSVLGVSPRSRLLSGATYEVVVDAGVRSSDDSSLASESQNLGTVQTAGALAFVRLVHVDLPKRDGVPGRFVDGAPALAFTNALEKASVANAVTITPALRDPARALSSDNGGSRGESGRIFIDPTQLDPDTAYDVHVGAGLTDLHHQHVLPVDVRFRTGALPGSFALADGITLVPLDAPPAFAGLEHVTEGDVHFVRRRIETDEPVYAGVPAEALPSPAAWPAVPASAPLAIEDASEAKEPKLVAFSANAPSYRYVDEYGETHETRTNVSGFLQRTDLGVHVESVGHQAVVHVSRLSDGSPVADAAVTILPMLDPTPPRKPAVACDGGKTDGDGLWISTASLQRCTRFQWWGGQSPAFVAVARSGADSAFVPLGELRGYQFSSGVSQPWYGALFTERGVYRPGDAVHVAGVVDTLERGTLEPVTAAVHVVLDGHDVAQTVPDAFGRIAVTIRLPAETAAVGSHTIVASPDRYGMWGIAQSVTVAEPRVPAFTNDLTAETPIVISGETAKIRAGVRTFTGQALPGARVTFSAGIEPIAVAPFAYHDFHFAFPPNWSEAGDPTVTTTTSSGGAEYALAIPRDLPFPSRYVVTSDAVVAGNSFGTSTEFLAKPAHAFAGVEAHGLAIAGRPYAVRVVVVDADGNPRAGRHMRLTLDRVWYDPPEHGDRDVHASRYRHTEAIASRSFVSAAGPVTVDIAPPVAAEYVAKVDFESPAPGERPAESSFVAAGPSEAAQPSIALDRASYRVGDVARASIETPYADAGVIVEVVRNGVLRRASLRVARTGFVNIPITEAMLPNATVRMLAVRRTPLGAPSDIAGAVATASTPLVVTYPQHVLRVNVIAAARRDDAGSSATIHVVVRDARNRGVRAGCVVAVVDDAVLAIDGYRFAPLAAAAYADRPIEDEEADNRQHPELSPHAWRLVTIGAVFAAPTQTTDHFTVTERGDRTNGHPVVPPDALAYFDASSTTDRNGDLTLHVALPGNATRWRVLVAATVPGTGFGNGEAAFRSVQSARVVTRVRYTRPGDSLVSPSVMPPAKTTLDAPAAPDVPPVDRIVDAGTISTPHVLTVTSVPGDMTTVSFDTFGSQVAEAKRAMAYSTNVRPRRDVEYAVSDRAFIENATRPGFVEFGGSYSQTAYAQARLLAAFLGQKPPVSNVFVRVDGGPALTARLSKEARDPVAANICDPGNARCASIAETFALDGLAALGVRHGDRLRDLAEHAGDMPFVERFMLAALLLADPGERDAGRLLAKKIDQTAAFGARTTRYSLAKAFQENLDWFDPCVQSEAFRFALVRDESDENIISILRALSDENGPTPCDAATSIREAYLLYAERFPPAFATASVSIDGDTPREIAISPDVAVTNVPLQMRPGVHRVTIDPHGTPVSYLLTVDAPATAGSSIDDGIGLSRIVRAVSPDETSVSDAVIASTGTDPLPALEIATGSIVAVSVRIVTDHPISGVHVVDPLPAGLEPIDTSLAVNRGVRASWSSTDFSGIDFNQKFLADRVEARIGRLPPGVYEVRYLARAVAPGVFGWPAARADGLDGNGNQGRSATTSVRVR